MVWIFMFRPVRTCSSCDNWCRQNIISGDFFLFKIFSVIMENLFLIFHNFWHRNKIMKGWDVHHHSNFEWKIMFVNISINKLIFVLMFNCDSVNHRCFMIKYQEFNKIVINILGNEMRLFQATHAVSHTETNSTM